jgi:hypothetical protein
VCDEDLMARLFEEERPTWVCHMVRFLVVVRRVRGLKCHTERTSLTHYSLLTLPTGGARGSPSLDSGPVHLYSFEYQGNDPPDGALCQVWSQELCVCE